MNESISHERIGIIEGLWPVAHSRDGRVFVSPAGEPGIKTGREKGERSMNLSLAYL